MRAGAAFTERLGGDIVLGENVLGGNVLGEISCAEAGNVIVDGDVEAVKTSEVMSEVMSEVIMSSETRSSNPNGATPAPTVSAALNALVASIDGKAHPSAFCSDMLSLPPKLTLADLPDSRLPTQQQISLPSQDRRQATRFGPRSLCFGPTASSHASRTGQMQAYFFWTRKGLEVLNQPPPGPNGSVPCRNRPLDEWV